MHFNSFTLCVFLLAGQAWAGSVAEETYKREAKDTLKTCTLANGDGDECANPDGLGEKEGNSTESKDSISTAICLDDRNECPQYAKRGDCKTNPRFMNAHCKLVIPRSKTPTAALLPG
jgi:hypothetical protein